MLDRYVDQVRLIVDVLPHIAKEDVFALKGGTAINLFYRDMPRLSVDIDLTYLPVKDRQASLRHIDETFGRIMEAFPAEVRAIGRGELPAVATATPALRSVTAEPKQRSRPRPSPAARCFRL